MKKSFLLLFSFFTFVSFAQNINEYEFFNVPTKFDFQSTENEYRLNTLLKFRLEEYGFKVNYITSQMNTNYEDRCLYLVVNVVDESTTFLTKYYVEFRDCNNVLVSKSAVGVSKNKDRKEGATEALENALQSVKALNYQFVGKKAQVAKTETKITQPLQIQKTEILQDNLLFAQPILNGFQLVDATPKVVFKLLNTSRIDFFIATSQSKNGVLLMENGKWFFEYYENNKLISEFVNIKF